MYGSGIFTHCIVMQRREAIPNRQAPQVLGRSENAASCGDIRVHCPASEKQHRTAGCASMSCKHYRQLTLELRTYLWSSLNLGRSTHRVTTAVLILPHRHLTNGKNDIPRITVNDGINPLGLSPVWCVPRANRGQERLLVSRIILSNKMRQFIPGWFGKAMAMAKVGAAAMPGRGVQGRVPLTFICCLRQFQGSLAWASLFAGICWRGSRVGLAAWIMVLLQV
ncbi:hypothetical protein BU17DRAFT_71836 [Hysterangium stoloniferum]|nr:hypothetical protein BU17DRAFT_71836 [Hysterangium stoloniferum]